MVSKLLFLLKWIVIPAALGAGGYYFLGPQIGAKIGPPKISESAKTPDTSQDTTIGDSPTASQFPAPAVDIDSHPMTSETASPATPKPKKHRRHKTKPASPSAPPAGPPGDAPPADTPPPADASPPPG